MNGNFQDYGVTGTWVKSQDEYGRMTETFTHPTTDAARADYRKRLADPGTVFAQWGARTIEGPIVLGEYRR